MRSFHIGTLLAIFTSATLSLSCAAASKQGKVYTHQELSPIEKALFKELNKVRQNPRAYAEQVLLPQSKMFQGRRLLRPKQVPLLTQEGAAAYKEAIRVLRNTPSMPLFTASKGMSRAARAHAKDLAQHQKFGHRGSDGSSPFERINRHGKWNGTAAENISGGSYSAQDIVVSLLVDDGVPSRGHRKNILNPQLKYLGVGCTDRHPQWKRICVTPFAAHYTEAK